MEITATAAKSGFSALLRRVEVGREAVTITLHGRAVAIVAPAADADALLAAALAAGDLGEVPVRAAWAYLLAGDRERGDNRAEGIDDPLGDYPEIMTAAMNQGRESRPADDSGGSDA